MEVTERDLREEIQVMQEQQTDTLQMASEMSDSLNDSGKEMVVRAAYRIAASDGQVDPTETAFLDKLAHTLKLSRAHFRGSLAEGIEDKS